VKIGFIFTALLYNYTKHHDPRDTKKQAKLFILKEQIDFVYVFMMSILLLINFNPWTPIYIDMETKALFFIYGIITIITAKYSTFRDQSIIYNMNKQQNDSLELLLKPTSISNNNYQKNNNNSQNNYSDEYLIS
jgi:hypothetical protein